MKSCRFKGEIFDKQSYIIIKCIMTIGRRYFYLEKNEYHQVAASDFLWYIYIVKTFAEAFEMYKAPSML